VAAPRHDDTPEQPAHNRQPRRRTLNHKFMITGRNGQITTKTARDHDSRPECLNLELRHNGIYGGCGAWPGPRRPRYRGNGLHDALLALAKARVLESREEPAEQFRWRRSVCAPEASG